MSNLVTVQRVTVIVDSKLEQPLVARFAKLGAKGYTVIECRGRGEHEIIADAFTGATRVRIETIVQPKVAAAIMAYLHEPHFANDALTVCVETVQVDPSDRF